MAAILLAESVTVRFGGVTALKDVCLRVEKGEFLSLIGPNGAGKTTLLNTITGIVTPEKASLKLGNKDISNLSTHKRIQLGLALTHQIVRPFRSMTVLENVAFAAGFKKLRNIFPSLITLNRSPEKKKALEFLEMVGITQYKAQQVSKLPLGVLKRLEVARALAIEPQILLLDEPLAGLNSQEAGKLADTIKSISKQGMTIVMIEHNLSEVLRVSDRLHVLDNGKDLAQGDPRVVMSKPEVRTAYLGVQ
ncbi:MAG: ABC transporter ATP-binding protein [Proteobacteria bacterium]|nr:ABC transporter ATP-binding protein [Pseudomonadota bacterium]MBU1584331.1 ABC transporter ATP-binding protein [Pseudomonadota bacterium]MBU2455407.1 ABC transporter ATP-binding protein [Pseudomonadota bacterium]MBU2631149.1 ABC transporter ATP-binding protein [Pseudomonadota bacterium]